jgi:hypothetical protein
MFSTMFVAVVVRQCVPHRFEPHVSIILHMFGSCSTLASYNVSPIDNEPAVDDAGQAPGLLVASDANHENSAKQITPAERKEYVAHSLRTKVRY